MNDYHLAHHGIKGMKWGVRRFRNRDGTLTEEGKRRYYDSDGKLTKDGAKFTKDAVQAKSAIAGAKTVVSGAQRAANAADKRPRNRYNKRPNLTQDEIDKMGDKELRELVNRLNLEQQYSQLTEDYAPRGKVQTGLEYASSILEIAGGMTSIYMAYRLIKG